MSEDKRSPFGELSDVVIANQKAGHYWFTKGAMQYFGTRIESRLIRGRYFITSEQREEHEYVDARGQTQPPTERRHAIRYANDDGTISTVGEMMQYATEAEAMTALLSIDSQ